MAINFPNNPVINDTFTFGPITYTWNGTSWVSLIQSEGQSISDTLVLSQEDYDDLLIKNVNTIYFIENQTSFRVEKAYIGEVQIYSGTVPVTAGEAVFTIPGTTSWTAPDGVTSVSVIALGGGGSRSATSFSSPNIGIGGSGGGGLGWKNNIPVVPGQTYTVVVGGSSGNSYFIDISTVAGFGGQDGGNGVGGSGGSFVGDGGSNGGSGASSTAGSVAGGGGRAGGYPGGSGGSGVTRTSTGVNTLIGSRGGGTGIYGQGLAGANATFSGGITTQATAGSGGNTTNPLNTPSTIQYGGGAGGAYKISAGSFPAESGGLGAVRIVWGQGRAFPNIDVGLTP